MVCPCAPVLLILTLSMYCAPGSTTAATPRNSPTAREWVPGELVVGLDPSASPNFATVKARLPQARDWRTLKHCGFSKKRQNEPNPLECVRVVTLPPGADIASAAQAIARLPGVAYAHPNYLITPASLPDDPYFESHQYAPQAIGAPQAWSRTTGGPDVLIAVIDSGLRFDHQDLQGAIWPNDDPVNGLDDDGNGFIDDAQGWDFINADSHPDDTNGHGTHVAGIIAARIGNGVGIAGLCQGTLMPLQVFENGVGTWTALAEAITYAVDNDASVINFSGGGYGGDGLVAQAVQYAWRNNVPVIAAAGNHGSSMSYYPAAYAEAIAVAAVGPNDVYMTQSGRGPHLDVCAPGVNIWSTYVSASDDYRFATGTSMATAHVTGLVGLMLSINPKLDVEEIRALLHATAVDFGPVGFDEMFGYGRIDAAAALAATAADVDPPYIAHDGGAETNLHSGYIDPRVESDDGETLDRGLRTFVIAFDEPIRDIGATTYHQLLADAFAVSCTGDPCPRITSIDAAENPRIVIELDQPIPPGEWTTIVANVEDRSTNRIMSLGQLGPGVDEPDRVDIGFLPGDVDQSGAVDPFDLLQFRRIVNGLDAEGADDYVDMDRNGSIEPLDMLMFRQIVQGTPPVTTAWAGRRLPPRP